MAAPLKTRPYDGPNDADLPDAIKKLPAKAKEIWVAAFNSAWDGYDPETSEQDSQEGYANAVAWGTVNKKFKQQDGKWVPRVYVLYSFEAPLTRVQDQAGKVTWETTASDDGVDKYATRMTVELHDDFIRNAAQMGMPFLTIAHFNQLARIGRADKLWRDGRRLKASGHFFVDAEDPLIRDLARAAADTALEDMNLPPRQRKVRTSIGFKPGPGGVTTEDLGVLAYVRGYLAEITMTTHPGNSRVDFSSERSEEMKVRISPDFMEQDAATIVGEDLAKKLRALFETVAGRSAEDDPVEIVYRALEELGDETKFVAMAYQAGDDAEKRVKVEEGFKDIGRTVPWKRDQAKLIDRLEELDDLRILQEAELVGEEKVAIVRAKLSLDIAAGKVKATDDESIELVDSSGAEVILLRTERFGDQELDVVTTEEVELVERAGRKLQGKRLDQLAGIGNQLSEAASGITEMVEWARAESEGKEKDGERSSDPIIQEGVDAAIDFQKHMLARFGGVEADDSLIKTMEQHSMMEVAFEAAMTLTDIVVANMAPDLEGSMEDRMQNVEKALNEYGQVIGSMLVSAFGGGRSAPPPNNGNQPESDPTNVNRAGDGTGPVNASDGSQGLPDLTGLDAAVAKKRQLVLDGAPVEDIQAAMAEEVKEIETILGEQPENDQPPVGEETVARVAQLEIGMSQATEGISEILERLDARQEPESLPRSYGLPRRRSLPAGPPPAATPKAQPRQIGRSRLGQAQRLTIGEAVEQSMGEKPLY